MRMYAQMLLYAPLYIQYKTEKKRFFACPLEKIVKFVKFFSLTLLIRVIIFGKLYFGKHVLFAPYAVAHAQQNMRTQRNEHIIIKNMPLLTKLESKIFLARSS